MTRILLSSNFRQQQPNERGAIRARKWLAWIFEFRSNIRGDRLRSGEDKSTAATQQGQLEALASVASNHRDSKAETGTFSAFSAYFAGASWPQPLADEAFYGLAGEIIHLIEPHTEADPAALLLQFLVAFGNVIGRGPHFTIESDAHHTNLFVTVVGETAKARKGTSWGYITRLFREIDKQWAEDHVQDGLSSGEGLIWRVRDSLKSNK